MHGKGGGESSEHEVTSVESPNQQPMGGKGGIIERGRGGAHRYIFMVERQERGREEKEGGESQCEVTSVESSNQHPTIGSLGGILNI